MGYRHLYWRCPYFTDDRKDEILCEGGYRIFFPDAAKLKKHAETYCCSIDNYKRCPFAAQLEKGYEEFFKRREENVK